MARDYAQIRTDIWAEPRWTRMSREAQLYAITCRGLSTTGKVTPERVASLTGWDRESILRCREEVVKSGFAYLLGDKRKPLPLNLRDAVYARDGRLCAFCGSTARLQIDHRHPVALGGSDDMENLQVLCQPCNLKKGARFGVVQG